MRTCPITRLEHKFLRGAWTSPVPEVYGFLFSDLGQRIRLKTKLDVVIGTGFHGFLEMQDGVAIKLLSLQALRQNREEEPVFD
jgi:hypothetical protein